MEDLRFMGLALREARAAAALGEVPVGAVVVVGGEVVASAHNRRELDGDPTAHAELLAVRRAAEARGHWRLHDATVYITLEPCPMCAGAMVNARVARVVFGAFDPKAGASGSLYRLLEDKRLNHRCEVRSGVLEGLCAAELTRFFRALRQGKGLPKPRPSARDRED